MKPTPLWDIRTQQIVVGQFPNSQVAFSCLCRLFLAMSYQCGPDLMPQVKSHTQNYEDSIKVIKLQCGHILATM